MKICDSGSILNTIFFQSLFPDTFIQCQPLSAFVTLLYADGSISVRCCFAKILSKLSEDCQRP